MYASAAQLLVGQIDADRAMAAREQIDEKRLTVAAAEIEHARARRQRAGEALVPAALARVIDRSIDRAAAIAFAPWVPTVS